MNGDYEEQIDEALDLDEDQRELYDAQLDQYDAVNIPSTAPKSDLYTWFWKVVKLDDTDEVVRVGNLNNKEIGEFGVSVRDSINLADLGKIFNHKKFAKYWENRAKVTSATSMAKAGWFMDLSISQKKVRHRERSQSTTPIEKQGWFRKKKSTSGQGEQP